MASNDYDDLLESFMSNSTKAYNEDKTNREKAVEYLHRILVLVVLAVGEVDHGRQVCPVDFVVRRLRQQLLVLVRVVLVGDDLLARPQ